MLVECQTKNQVLENFLIRKIVFIDEQKVSYEDEYDLKEINGKMYLYEVNGIYTSCLRILYDSKTKAHIGRVATLKEYRKKGISLQMMHDILIILKQEGIKEVELDAQVSALGFYEKLGFKVYGDIFLDANIPHKHMIKEL